MEDFPLSEWPIDRLVSLKHAINQELRARKEAAWQARYNPPIRPLATCQSCQKPIWKGQEADHHTCEVGLTAYIVSGNYDDYDHCHILYLEDAHSQIVASTHTFDLPYGEPIDPFIEEQIHRVWPWVTIDYARCHVVDDL